MPRLPHAVGLPKFCFNLCFMTLLAAVVRVKQFHVWFMCVLYLYCDKNMPDCFIFILWYK